MQKHSVSVLRETCSGHSCLICPVQPAGFHPKTPHPAAPLSCPSARLLTSRDCNVLSASHSSRSCAYSYAPGSPEETVAKLEHVENKNIKKIKNNSRDRKYLPGHAIPSVFVHFSLTDSSDQQTLLSPQLLTVLNDVPPLPAGL